MQLHVQALPASEKLGRAKRIATAVTLGLGLCLSLSAVAKQHEELEQGGSQWSLGIAAISNQKAFTDIDRDTIVLPFITYENQYVRWFGPTVDFKLPGFTISDAQQLDFSITLDYDFGGYDKDDIKDTPVLNGMDKRKGGVWAGTKIEWKTPWLEVSAKWMSDISDNSDGQRLSIGLERSWMFGRHVMLSPRLMVTWQDDKFVDYHYGVRSHEVRLDRPGYSGDAAVNIEYGIRSAYMFDQHQSVFIDVGITSLGKEIKNSPLVDSSTESRIMLAYMYRF